MNILHKARTLHSDLYVVPKFWLVIRNNIRSHHTINSRIFPLKTTVIVVQLVHFGHLIILPHCLWILGINLNKFHKQNIRFSTYNRFHTAQNSLEHIMQMRFLGSERKSWWLRTPRVLSEMETKRLCGLLEVQITNWKLDCLRAHRKNVVNILSAFKNFL